MAKHQRLRRTIWGLTLLSMLLFLFSACASIPKADPALVSKYTSPVGVNDQETLIYVIRQDTMVGAAQGLWVACNEKYIADLTSGSYTFFKVKADLNTINLRQMKIPVAFKNVDFRSGETVFLFFEYTKGLSEVDKDTGKTIVMQYKKVDDENNNEVNTDFEIGLMNPGFLELPLMKETTAIPEPDAAYATVTFLRPQSFADKLNFGIWNQDGLLGNLKGETQFTVKLSPGKHYFIANSRYYSALKADLLPGKKYYVLVEASMGWAQANLSLSSIKADVEQNKIQEWINKSKKMELDPKAIDAKIKKRLDAGLPLVQRTIGEVNKGSLEAKIMEAKDGR